MFRAYLLVSGSLCTAILLGLMQYQMVSGFAGMALVCVFRVKYCLDDSCISIYRYTYHKSIFVNCLLLASFANMSSIFGKGYWSTLRQGFTVAVYFLQIQMAPNFFTNAGIPVFSNSLTLLLPLGTTHMVLTGTLGILVWCYLSKLA